MNCDNCGTDCGRDYERVGEQVLCVECWERACDAYENATEARYYREK